MRYFPRLNEVMWSRDAKQFDWCDLPEDVSLWHGLPLSLSGDEVMPLDYHAGRSGWLLYGRGLNKHRLTEWQRELGAALVIVASGRLTTIR